MDTLIPKAASAPNMQPTPHPDARTENNLAHYEWLRRIFDEVNMIDPLILAQAIENAKRKVIEWLVIN